MGAEMSAEQCACDGNHKAGPANQPQADEIAVAKADSADLSPDAVASLLVVERVATGQHLSSNASNVSHFSSAPSEVSSMTSKGRRISLYKTPGLSGQVPSAKLDKTKLATFKEKLHRADIDTIKWGYSGAKSVEHLYWEAYEQRGCVIISVPGGKSLKRVTRMVKINVVAEIFGVDKTLYSRMQFMHDGQVNERRQVPLQRLRWQKIEENEIKEWKDEFSAEECESTEQWRTIAAATLEARLGLSQAWQQAHLEEVVSDNRFTSEDDVPSDGYPGLNTLYCIHEVTYKIRDPMHPGVALIGLPDGQEFATAEGDFSFDGHRDQEGQPIGTQLNIWMWGSLGVVPKPEKVHTKSTSVIAANPAKTVAEERANHRMMPNAVSIAAMQTMDRNLINKTERAPNQNLWAALKGTRTDWTRAKKIANQIQNPSYSLEQYMDDLQAFPELNLYLLENRKEDAGDANSGEVKAQTSSSGRTMGDEYQRTVGCFLAIYWLVRMDIDGKDGFCNGVDVEGSWEPITLTGKDDKRCAAPEKRIAFREKAMWPFFQRLLMNAGIFEKKSGWPFKGKGFPKVNEKRLVALLALTAVHDIMKMKFLLPEVQAEHAPYQAYAAGDTIGDHDHALSYIMDYYPNALPSFCDLDEADRRSVKFTQCNLSFNHGWLVQGEAPPGAIFTKFRETLIRDHKSQITQKDVALYFLHWITDLAGAEPTPLAGCEKFVTKFPMPVLNSFLRSFEVVETITNRTETQVNEDYLCVRWKEAEHGKSEDLPSGWPVPTGDSAIAKMRLGMMAQMNCLKVLNEFDDLVDEDREVLSLEMARTGCVGQHYNQNLIPKEAYQVGEGPAFLIYYGPAYLQSLGEDSPVKRLSILAEVYRRARELWPAQVAKMGQNVTIRVDMIKSLTIAQMQEAVANGDVWIMLKHNESEAFLERTTHKKVNKLIAGGQQLQIIDISCVLAYRAHSP